MKKMVFCIFFSLPILIEGSSLKSIITTNRKYVLNHSFFTSNKTAFEFIVKTCDDAYFGLLFVPSPNGIPSDLIEILLGGSLNSTSQIRLGMNGNSLYTYPRPVLNCNGAYKPFWISWLNGAIEVGTTRHVGTNVFMRWSQPLARQVKRVVVSSNVRADWYIDADIPCRHETIYINSTGLLDHNNKSTLTYQCNLTLISGDLQRQCLPTGHWSGREPICDITCGNQTAIINSSGDLSKINGFKVGNVLTYGCTIGDLSASFERKCLSNGTWSGQEPDCDMLSRCHNRHRHKKVDIDKEIKEIKIDKKRTSKYTRTKKSITDKRTSSRVMGGFAISILVVALAAIIILDLPNLVQHIKRPFIRLKKRCKK